MFCEQPSTRERYFTRRTTGSALRQQRENRRLSPEVVALYYSGGVPLSRILEVERLSLVDRRIRRRYQNALDVAAARTSIPTLRTDERRF
jgi:hypothetical protein